jgi:hypothetical protein
MVIRKETHCRKKVCAISFFLLKSTILEFWDALWDALWAAVCHHWWPTKPIASEGHGYLQSI